MFLKKKVSNTTKYRHQKLGLAEKRGGGAQAQAGSPPLPIGHTFTTVLYNRTRTGLLGCRFYFHFSFCNFYLLLMLRTELLA